MRSDQLTHPVAVIYTSHRMWGISGSPYLVSVDPPAFWEPGRTGLAGYNGFYCSVEKNAEAGFTVGYVDYPGIYTSPWEYTVYTADRQGCVSIPAGATLRFEVRVFSFASDHGDALGRIIENVYDVYHAAPLRENHASDGRTTADVSRAIAEEAYSPVDNNYALIMMKPISELKRNVYEMKRRFDPTDYTATCERLIGWTNGAVIAAPLLQAACRLDDRELRGQAVKVIDEIVGRSLNPATGIPNCAKINGAWTNQGWWTPWIKSEGVEPGHSSYIIGQALYYIVKAFELEKDRSRKHAAWLDFVGNVITVVTKTQDEDGAFPRFWDETSGAGTGYDAFAGCWVAAAIANYIRLASRTDLLPAALKAETHYYKDVVRMECSQTPLDAADAPDTEGILAYIRLAKILSEITGEKTDDGVSYLDRMRTGIDYALSFTYCYNVPSLAPPLDAAHWSSSCGSITSVCNAVIHCMLNSILDEIHYYYVKSGNQYYGKRLVDIYDWGLQIYNRKECEFSFGRKGWLCEYFCQANRYMLDVCFPGGNRPGIWFAYHPWATASVLEGLCGDLWDAKP